MSNAEVLVVSMSVLGLGHLGCRRTSVSKSLSIMCFVVFRI